MIWLGLYSRPFSRLNLRAIAALSSGMPSTAVYFDDLPPSIALMAARLMCSGVSKSGSPAPSPITSRPLALSARALSVTAMVADGLMRLRYSASRAMRRSFHPLSGASLLMARAADGKPQSPQHTSGQRDDGGRGAAVERASLKYFGESRLELAPLLLDQIEVDGQEPYLAQRRLAGRRRDVDARGVDAALRDHLLRRR